MLSEQRLAAAGGADKQDVRLVDFNIMLVVGHKQSLVVAMHRNGENAFGGILANDVVFKFGDNLARRRYLGEQLLATAATFALLIENALTQLDAFAADVNVARALD